MRLPSTIIAALLVPITIASVIPPTHPGTDSDLTKRACNCACKKECRDGCFANPYNGGMASGFCVLSCGAACNCASDDTSC